jgi:hypothetical protein
MTSLVSSELLSKAFSKAPSYDLRDELLARALPPRSIYSNSLPVLVFSAVFSRSKEATGLSWAKFFKSFVATLSLRGRSVVFRHAPSECLACCTEGRRATAYFPFPFDQEGDGFYQAATMSFLSLTLSAIILDSIFRFILRFLHQQDYFMLCKFFGSGVLIVRPSRICAHTKTNPPDAYVNHDSQRSYVFANCIFS